MPLTVVPGSITRAGSGARLNTTGARQGKQYVCTYCNKVMSKKSNLDSHLKIHQGVRPFRCRICGKACNVKGNLVRHIFLVHAISADCAAMFVEDLEKQRYRQLPPAPFLHRHAVCPVCHKLFPYKSALDVHMRIHRGSRPFRCRLCGKTCNVKSNLVRHISLVHQGRDESICPVCGKVFPYAVGLQAHLRAHGETRPFRCRLCGRTSKRKYNLVRHLSLVHHMIGSSAMNYLEQVRK